MRLSPFYGIIYVIGFCETLIFSNTWYDTDFEKRKSIFQLYLFSISGLDVSISFYQDYEEIEEKAYIRKKLVLIL